MSSITTDKGVVHYEVFGRGRPVILLHGWLGSWGMWQKTMGYLQKDYRTYALDFWGFGESGKNQESHSISDFVNMVDQFMEAMGIMNAPIIGHSMGGTVSLMLAIQYPERVKMVGVIGSPVVGTSLSLLLKLAATPFIAKIVHNMLWALKLGIRIAAPVITKEKTWPDMINDDLSKTTLDSFLYSIKSLHETDLREGVMGLEIPVLGIYGRKDVLVNPDQREILTDTVKLSQIAYFQDAGHFPMLDIPDKFMHTLKRFLDGETIVLVD